VTTPTDTAAAPDAADRDAAMARLVDLATVLSPMHMAKIAAQDAERDACAMWNAKGDWSPARWFAHGRYIEELLRVSLQLRQGIAAAAAALHRGDVAAAQRIMDGDRTSTTAWLVMAGPRLWCPQSPPRLLPYRQPRISSHE
jgi:hypothetical protein